MTARVEVNGFAKVLFQLPVRERAVSPEQIREGEAVDRRVHQRKTVQRELFVCRLGLVPGGS